jgi:hypothetical protein
MNETLDDARLRATEAQMRHALGLDGQTQAPRADEQSTSSGPAPDRLTLHRPPRRFVKDGEVPVTVVRRTHAPEATVGVAPATSNQLETARQTIRSQAAAAERAERALAEAQATIRDLRTKLAHERMAKEEAFATLQRLGSERDAATTTMQTLRMEVATERVGREKLGEELREAQEKRRAAEALPNEPARPRGRPRKDIVAAPGDPLEAPRKRGRPRKVVAAGETDLPALPRKRGRPRKVQATEQSALDLPTMSPAGRPVKEPKPVKWWVKGWQSKHGPRV